jgi:beta-1,4-mannosyltransferase
VQIINCTLYRDNPYQSALYSALEGRYEGVKGTIDDGIAGLAADGRALVHVHWEEHVVRGRRTAAEARAAADYFVRRLREFVGSGGRILWTVHNSMPHELEYPEVFQYIREALASVSERIIVHNTEGINVLSAQVRLDRRKLYFLPHPSYLGVYEPEEVTERAVEAPTGRQILAFGKLRRYKGLGRLIDMLPAEFLAGERAALRISGEPIRDDAYLPELRKQYAPWQDIIWDVRSIPDAEVPTLLRSARCLALPYERFLTSGVALLALSVGTIVVGPATMPMREVLPVEAQRFLFKPDSTEDFQRAVRDAMALGTEEVQELRRALLKRARYLHPHRISRQLGGLYDQMLAMAGAP